MDFSTVERVRVPPKVQTETHEQLRGIGKEGYEAFAFWLGTATGNDFNVSEVFFPHQSSLHQDVGACVFVSGEELHYLNRFMYQCELALIAQIHTHPDRAYHSETDDAFAIATAVGSFSIVIPRFAAVDFSIQNFAVYRLSASGVWDLLDVETSRRIFKL